MDIEPFADGGRHALDGQQSVAIVVLVSLPCILVELGQQLANGVTLEGSAALWPFSALAVANFVHPCQMPAQVVAKAPGQVVAGAVGKLVNRVIFIDQGSQTYSAVVLITYVLAANSVIQGIGDGHQMVALIIAVVDTFARAVLETLQLSQSIPPEVFVLERGIDDVWSRPSSLALFSLYHSISIL